NAAFIVPLLGVITAHHLAAGKSTQGRRLPVHYIRLGEGLLLSALGTFMLWATYQAWATY
ncbi:MAG: hypothetical protein U9R79_13005, partial [Armatimonadota bacterium]|nr:hypothetical protein [Armatimonadota bacterium]